MQPFPSPPRRGPSIAIALLAVGFLVASAIAVVEFVQLRAANERIEELEAEAGEGGGGLFEGLGDLIEDLLPEGEGGSGLSTLDCVDGQGLGLEPGRDTDRSIPAIAEEVERIRDLRFEEVPEPEFLTGEETSRRVRELFLEEYTPEIADLEQRILSSLGAIPFGTDLRRLRADALGGQVAGYYEPETGELVVRQGGGDISAIDRITLAHELDHALTDQALDIPLPDDIEVGTEDQNLAALALVEGDATMVMQRYSSGLGLEEQLEALDPAAIAEAEAGLAGLPQYLRQELLFPYQEGLEFVCDLYRDGGWAAIDEAYAAPPESSAQVLFPDRYQEDERPVAPRPPNDPAGRWEAGPVLELGAANLLWLFEAPGGDPAGRLDDPRAAAGEWAGGSITLWRRGAQTAVAVVLVDRPGGGRLCDPVAEWYRRAFPDDAESARGTAELITDGPRQDAVVQCTGEEVRLGIGPTRTVAYDVAL